MNRKSHLVGLVGLVGLVLSAGLLGACSDGGAETAANAEAPGTRPSAASSLEPSPSEPSPDGLADVALPVAKGADVDGLVEVKGHRLAVHCDGSGQPTAIILHGWIDQPGITSYDYYGGLTDNLEGDFRVCSYDRANVGDSETVRGTQTPEMVVGDLDGLMRAIGDPGPYVLIGQSAGGMVASAYAVAHPDKVVGIVMVDADFDDEIVLEDVGMVPTGMSPCDPVNRRADGHYSLQKINVCSMYRWAYQRRDLRPEVPLVYLAAKQAPWNGATEFGPAYTRGIISLQKSYAASWSPGRFVWVDSGHEIHSERPAVVGDAVRWVVKEGGR